MGTLARPPRGHPFSSVGSIDGGIISDLERTTTSKGDNGAVRVKRPVHVKQSISFPQSLVSATLISLVIVYFLLRCFRWTEARYRVAPLTRELAAGGRGKTCYGYAEDGESENDWLRDDSLTVGLEGTAGGQPAEHGSTQRSAWQTRDTRQWPTTPTPIALGRQAAIYGLASGLEPGAAAPALEFRSFFSQDADRVGFPQLQGVPGSEPGKLVGVHVEGTIDGRGHDGRLKKDFGVKLPEKETYDMWEQRNLPAYAEEQVVRLFQRMIESTSLCRPLL